MAKNFVLENFFIKAEARSALDREKKIAKFSPKPSKRGDFKRYGYEYFDSVDYGVGYGGYHYDGRYEKSVSDIIHNLNLSPGSRILEIGCAKGFILYEFYKHGMNVSGIDVSKYAISNAKPEIKPFLVQGSCEQLPWSDGEFDFVFCKEVLPHLSIHQLDKAIPEMLRVCSSRNIYLDIQVCETDRAKKMTNAWDETHQCLENSGWWLSYLEEKRFRGYLNFKVLFNA